LFDGNADVSRLKVIVLSPDSKLNVVPVEAGATD